MNPDEEAMKAIMANCLQRSESQRYEFNQTYRRLTDALLAENETKYQERLDAVFSQPGHDGEGSDQTLETTGGDLSTGGADRSDIIDANG